MGDIPKSKVVGKVEHTSHICCSYSHQFAGVSPEEIENKLSEKRLVEEVLVRENEAVIEAVIFPDYEYAKKKKITDINSELQKIIDEYNLTVPAYKKVYSLKVRETEFEKTLTKKIKRY